MAATGSGHTGIYNSRSGLPTFGNFGNTLLERSNPGLRKSTPDSEALASSDEEVEHSRLRSLAQSKTNPIRRSSVLTDQSHENRRLSFAGNSTHSPGPGSQPNTPGASHENWSTISPSVGAWNGASAYPFGTNIWGASSRDPPSRLQEVRNDTDSRQSYPVSSQPNLSVQRSMSFSVGQSEHNTSLATAENNSSPTIPGLTRRTSRPSNLGQEFGGLSRVSESEDAGFTMTSSQTHSKTQPRTLSTTSSHNLASSSGLHNTPTILRTTSSTSAFRNSRFPTSLLESSEVAVEDIDDNTAQARYPIRNTAGVPSRRLSDFQALPTRQPNAPPYSSTAFGSTRNAPQWSSNLDFGQLDTIPQSRRHSFADVPTRRGSMDTHEEDEHSYEDSSQGGVQVGHDATYFTLNDETRLPTQQEVQQQIQREHHQAIFGVTGPYGIPTNASSIGSFHGPNSAPLFVVNFKCCRSDIFYIQEGTGLSVKDGDLVIVEADRGTDLGCVQHTNVSLDAARKYKAKYAEQHFGWLMMFSNQTKTGAGNLFNPNAVVPGKGGSSQQGGGGRDNDLKPKMIKRLAQTHEIQALQEKEGNEARAKRVCQQKVIEHGLTMEILDAEFQMDGKKLTFYFFSTEYINFNSLVTDLFKMYKTRIWMSAINPASFQSPVSSLGITPLYSNSGPGGLGLASSAQSTNMYDEPREDLRYMPMSHNSMRMPQTSMPQHMTAAPQHQSAMPPLYYGGYGQTPQMPEYAPNQYGQHHDPFSSYSGAGAYGGVNSNNVLRNPQNPMANMTGMAQQRYDHNHYTPSNNHPSGTFQNNQRQGIHQANSSSTLDNQFGSLSLRG